MFYTLARMSFSIIKGEEIRVIKAKNWKVYLYIYKLYML